MKRQQSSPDHHVKQHLFLVHSSTSNQGNANSWILVSNYQTLLYEEMILEKLPPKSW